MSVVVLSSTTDAVPPRVCPCSDEYRMACDVCHENPINCEHAGDAFECQTCHRAFCLDCWGRGCDEGCGEYVCYECRDAGNTNIRYCAQCESYRCAECGCDCEDEDEDESNETDDPQSVVIQQPTAVAATPTTNSDDDPK